MSNRVDLHVSFAEKDQVRELGGRWDKNRKVWYVPEGVDASPFSQWLEERPQEIKPHDTSSFADASHAVKPNFTPSFAPTARSVVNIRADFYYVAELTRRCWRCTERSEEHTSELQS